MAELVKTFQDIWTTVSNNIGIPTSDTTSLARIKKYINMIYQQRIGAKSNFYWEMEETTIRHKKRYATGTVSVTQNSTTVTLSGAPTSSFGDSGSFLNYHIKIDGFDEIYRISAHTALATGITLETAYLGATNATASYKIWRPYELLPTNCAEVVSVFIDREDRRPLEGLGLQQFHNRRRLDPYYDGFPEYFTQHDHHDPSAGTGETESDRQRKLLIYPALNSSNDVTLNILYRKELTELDATTDEPLIPIEDRDVLVYGAEMMAWKNLIRDHEAYMLSKQEFEDKLNDMMSRNEAGSDYPQLSLDSTYNSLKRTRMRNG